ncbi:hypothetical protein BD410DRAFT_805342 [Rickenella mellea]|uniref:Uncharacterized protein n=1 Tax=Rickenella mellea TaxID=50990 RepID=A0A4Y7PWT7_9AGAM|nr:hypothetical protein BD410DRAFT_805342 [Rickenella mellea]
MRDIVMCILLHRTPSTNLSLVTTTLSPSTRQHQRILNAHREICFAPCASQWSQPEQESRLLGSRGCERVRRDSWIIQHTQSVASVFGSLRVKNRRTFAVENAQKLAQITRFCKAIGLHATTTALQTVNELSEGFLHDHQPSDFPHSTSSQHQHPFHKFIRVAILSPTHLESVADERVSDSLRFPIHVRGFGDDTSHLPGSVTFDHPTNLATDSSSRGFQAMNAFPVDGTRSRSNSREYHHLPSHLLSVLMTGVPTQQIRGNSIVKMRAQGPSTLSRVSPSLSAIPNVLSTLHHCPFKQHALSFKLDHSFYEYVSQHNSDRNHSFTTTTNAHEDTNMDLDDKPNAQAGQSRVTKKWKNVIESSDEEDNQESLHEAAEQNPRISTNACKNKVRTSNAPKPKAPKPQQRSLNDFFGKTFLSRSCPFDDVSSFKNSNTHNDNIIEKIAGPSKPKKLTNVTNPTEITTKLASNTSEDEPTTPETNCAIELSDDDSEDNIPPPKETKAAKANNSTTNDVGKGKRKGPAPYTAEERDEARKEKNAMRRERRAGKPIEGRTLTDEENTVLATVHAEIFNIKATNHLELRTLATHSPYPQIILRAREHDSLETIHPTNPLWARLARVEPLLRDFTTHPLSFDIKKLVATGMLSPKQVNENNCQALYYVRIMTFDNVYAFRTAVIQYLIDFPADLPHAIFLLALAGTSPDEMEDAVAQAYGERHKGATDTLFDHLSSLAELDLGLPANKPVHLPYIGYSIAGTHTSRAEDDALNPEHSRVLNFTKATGYEFTVYRIPLLDYVVSGPLEVRTNPTISETESATIVCLLDAALNSARAPWNPVFIPPAHHREVVKRALEMAPKFNLGDTIDNELTGTIRNRYKDEAQVQSLEHAMRNAADSIRKVDGEVPLATIQKDVTREDFDGTVDGMFGATIGHGLRMRRHIRSLTQPTTPRHGSLSSDEVAQYFGPHIDLWRVTRIHKHLNWDVLFLSRILREIKPLVLVSASGIVTHLVREFRLLTIWDDVKDPTEFLAGKSPSNLNRLLPCPPSDKKPAEFSGEDFLAELLKFPIVRYGPGPTDYAINVAIRDDGSIKYEPREYADRCGLQHLSQALADVMTAVAVDMHQKTPMDRTSKDTFVAGLKAIRKQAEDIIKNSDVMDTFLAQSSSLRKREWVHTHLRHVKGSGAGISVTRGPVNRENCVLAANGPDARQAQFEKIVDLERERVDLGNTPNMNYLIPFPWKYDSVEFREWFMGLSDGTDIIASANALGRTPESQESIRRARLRLMEKHAAYRAAKQVVNPTNNLRACTEEERARIPELLAEAISDLSQLAKIKECTVDLSISVCWRWATCDRCHHIVVAKGNAMKHFCADGMDYAITVENFSSTRRLLYPHNIINEPVLRAFLPTLLPGNLDLVSLNVRDTLLHHPSAPTLSYGSVDSSLTCYVHRSHAGDQSFRLTVAFDAAVPFLTHFPSHQLPTYPNAIHLPWQTPSFNPVRCVLFEEGSSADKRRTMYNVCCNHGFSSIMGSQPSKPTKLTFLHNCAKKDTRNCKTQIGKQVHQFINLPPEWMRRVWFYSRVESDEKNFRLSWN